MLDPDQVTELKESAERLALAVGYRGAGTVEFLYHPQERSFAFLEVNTRLQVEHPITELTTDVDLVKAQIHVAAGGRLEGTPPVEQGHAVEARLNAEDPDRDFAPAPGRIALLRLPAGPGIRVDTGVSEGDTIPADFDSMIAKIIAYGRTRAEALARLRRALAETAVVIEGGTTNKSFVLDLLAQPELVDGSRRHRVDRPGPHRRGGCTPTGTPGWPSSRPRSRPTRRRSRSSASGCSRPPTAAVLRPGTRSAAPSTSSCAGWPTGSRSRGSGRTGSGSASARPAPSRPSTPSWSGWTPTPAGWSSPTSGYRLLTATHGPILLVEVDGVTHRVSRDEGGVMRSPAPALVVATPVAGRRRGGGRRAGDGPGEHEDGDGAARAVRRPGSASCSWPPAARSRPVRRSCASSRVPTPRPTAPEEAPETAADLELPAQADASAYDRAVRGLDDLRSLLLGFDLDPRDEGRTLSGYLPARRRAGRAGDCGRSWPRLDVLRVFADLSELSRNRPAEEETTPRTGCTARASTSTPTCRAWTSTAAALPEAFRTRLGRVARALRRRPTLDATPELQEAVFRIFLAQQRTASDVDGRHRAAAAVGRRGGARTGARRRGRARCSTGWCWPPSCASRSVGDLARSIRFRWYDQPLVEAERGGRRSSGVRGELSYLAVAPGRAGPRRPHRRAGRDPRADRAVPRAAARARASPSASRCSRRWPGATTASTSCTTCAPSPSAGRPFVVGDYSLDDRPTHLVATLGTLAELADPRRRRPGRERGRAGRRRAGGARSRSSTSTWPGRTRRSRRTRPRRGCAELLASVPFATRVRRVAIAVCPGRRPRGLLLHLPARAGRDRRGRPGPRRAPDGRPPAQPLAAAQLPDHPAGRARGRAALPLRRQGQRGRPAARRARPDPPVRHRRATRTARSSRCPHAERAVASCLEAIRRARSVAGA